MPDNSAAARTESGESDSKKMAYAHDLPNNVKKILISVEKERFVLKETYRYSCRERVEKYRTCKKIENTVNISMKNFHQNSGKNRK